MILHIARQSDWQRAQDEGSYRIDSLATEGFIHCSTPEQVLGPANAFYRGQDDLIILVIEPARLEAALVYEDVIDSGQDFPHIYGSLNLDAVVSIVTFPPDCDGRFSLPPAIAVLCGS